LASTPASTSGKEKADTAAAFALSAVINATGLTVAAIADTASEPCRKLRRENRLLMISPMVGLALELCPSPSASSSCVVGNGLGQRSSVMTISF
jgi:hypothetical protein